MNEQRIFSTGTQIDCTMNINMLYLCGTTCGVNMQQDTYAFTQAVGHRNLAPTHQRYLCPAHGPSRLRRKHRVQVFCDRENSTGDIRATEVVLFDHELQ